MQPTQPTSSPASRTNASVGHGAVAHEVLPDVPRKARDTITGTPWRLRIGYERNFGNVPFNVIQNPPNYAVISVTSGVDVPQGTLPIFTNKLGPLAGAGSTCGGNPAVVPGTSCFPQPNLRAVQQNIPTAYVQFWSGAIDYQVVKNSVLSIGGIPVSKDGKFILFPQVDQSSSDLMLIENWR